MGRYRAIKNSLLGGQVSGNAVGRTDLPQYPHACEILQNIIPLLSGGGYRRPGTLFWDMIPALNTTYGGDQATGFYQSSPPRIFPFVISNQQAFAVLIGTMRWCSAGPNNPNALNGGAYLISYKATANLNYDPVGGAVQYGKLPYRCKTVAGAPTGTYEMFYQRQGGPGAAENTGTNAGSVAVIDVADSLGVFDDDIWSVQYTQANDVMFLTHPDYQPQVLYFDGSTIKGVPYDSGLTDVSLAQTRPYLNQNTTAATMKYTYSGGGATGTLTSSVSFFDPLHGPRTGCSPEGAAFPATDGAIFALAVAEGSTVSGGGGILFLQVTSYSSATVCNVKRLGALPGGYSSATTVTAWWESAWSNYRGWPKSCGIYQQRLCFAATKHQPNALWFTATGSYGAPNSTLQTFSKFTALGDTAVKGATGVLANGQNYTTAQDWVYYPVDDSQGDGQSTGPLGAQPFRVSLATTTLDAIQYLSPDQQLFIGTAQQEWVGAPENGSFDVANSTFTIQSHYGSDLIQAVRIGYELMFVLQKKDEVRAYQYNYFDQSFFGEPVQLFFDEYPTAEQDLGDTTTNPYNGRKKYRSIDWDSSRSTLWCVGSDGNLFGLTRDRKLQVTTWHTHQLGGYNASHGQEQNLKDNLSNGSNYYTDSANFLCDGSVVSACSIPNPLSGIKDIWMVVKRSIADQTVWTVERMVGANTVRQTAFSDIAPGLAQEPLYADCAVFLSSSHNFNPSDLTLDVPAVLGGFNLVGTYYSKLWGIFELTCTGPAVVLAAPNGSFAEVTLAGDMPDDFNPAGDGAYVMIMGAQYAHAIKPVRAEMQSPIGTSEGTIKRPSKLYARVYRSMYFQAGSPPKGTEAAHLEETDWEQPSEEGQSIEIYTGLKEFFLPNDFDREGYVYIYGDKPLPFTLVSLSTEGESYEQ